LHEDVFTLLLYSAQWYNNPYDIPKARNLLEWRKKTDHIRLMRGEGPVLDEIDRMLLSLLKQDTRRKYSELGEIVHLSPPAVHERVKKLERAGVIRGYTIEIAPDALGLSLYAFVRLRVSRVPCEELAHTLRTFSEVEECYSSAGTESMMIKVHTATPATLELLLDRIRQMPGVEGFQTSIVLATHFQRENIPMD
jgi:Lrp/AsnC family transcriptional regulator, leucine-responsive regulatory protein